MDSGVISWPPRSWGHAMAQIRWMEADALLGKLQAASIGLGYRDLGMAPYEQELNKGLEEVRSGQFHDSGWRYNTAGSAADIMIDDISPVCRASIRPAVSNPEPDLKCPAVTRLANPESCRAGSGRSARTAVTTPRRSSVPGTVERARPGTQAQVPAGT